MNRIVTTSALVLLAGCCERCHEPDSFERTIDIDMTLGEIGADCSGSDSVRTDEGTFTATYYTATISGVEVCVAEVAWTDGVLVDMADIWADVEASPPPGVDLNTVEVLIHQLAFDVPLVAELVDASGNTMIAPEDVSLRVALVDPRVDVSTNDAFDDPLAFAAFAKPVGEGLQTAHLTHGPANVDDYAADGTWPYVDRANRAFRDLGPLEVAGRAVAAFPVSLLGSGTPRLAFSAQMTIYADVSACAPFPPPGDSE